MTTRVETTGEALIKTIELEASGVIPYTLDHGVFKSNRTYPTVHHRIDICRCTCACKCCSDKCKRASDMDGTIDNHGDVLLSVYSSDGSSFSLKLISENMQIDSIDGKVDVFNDGLVIVGQFGRNVHIIGTKPDVHYYSVFEYYGTILRRALASYHDEADADLGIKIMKGTEMYQVIGRMNIGHSCNGLQLIS